MGKSQFFVQRPMSQLLAAENAWRAMEAADVALIESDYVEARAYVDNAKGWAAVASQFQFVMSAEPPPLMHFWPADGREIECGIVAMDAPRTPSVEQVTCQSCRDAVLDRASTDVRIEDTLRINPMTETLSETVVLPRVVDPGQGGSPWQDCYCDRGSTLQPHTRSDACD